MASSHLKQFRYEPVSSEKPQIRLLKLADISNSTDSVLEEDRRYHWQLTVYDLESAPQYHALSYTWGCPYAKEELKQSQYVSVDWDSSSSIIFVNDQPFPVRNNLHCFFQSSQFDKTAENLWIDAICVDQDSELEGKNQDRKMRDVYRHATSVIIWLGPADSGIDMVFNVLDASPQHLQSYSTTVFSIPAHPWHIRMLSRFTKESPLRFLKTLLALCRRAYWNRTWIIQEILLAPHLHVRCGKLKVQWTVFASLITEVRRSCLFVDDDTSLLFDETVAWFVSSRQENSLNKGYVWDLESLAQVFGKSNCSKAHDRIYGLAGLVHKGDDLKVDYKISLVTLYLRVVTFLPHRDLFSFCRQVAQMLKLPMKRLLPDISQDDARGCPIAEIENFSLTVPLVHVGTVDTNGLKMSPTYSASSFERLPYSGKFVPCHACKAVDCRDIVVPEVTLRVFQIRNTELLLAYRDTYPATFVAIGIKHNMYLDGSATISFHRVGIAFPSLSASCQFDQELSSSSSQACSCRIEINYSVFDFLMSRTVAFPGPETGQHTNKWRKWLLDNHHVVCDPG